jgi:peptidoglycan/xylan/chitin deacetylase (PgdA/CDA1 family)
MSPTWLDNTLRASFPKALWQGNPDRREIALTFDDGPHPSATPDLLALLERHQVKATFFHIGQRAARAPQLVQQVLVAGHQIGLHGYQHHSFLLKSRMMLLRELAKVQSALADASGQPTASFHAMRPPFGHFTPSILNALLTSGYLPAMWSLVPFHWLQPADVTERQILEGVGNGTILVLHEGLRGPAVADLTQAVLPQLIDAGYRFVTINEMSVNLRQRMP